MGTLWLNEKEDESAVDYSKMLISGTASRLLLLRSILGMTSKGLNILFRVL